MKSSQQAYRWTSSINSVATASKKDVSCDDNLNINVNSLSIAWTLQMILSIDPILENDS